MSDLFPGATEHHYLLFSKKQVVEINGEEVKINGASPATLPEGITAKDYAAQHTRSAYERYMRDCLMADNLIVLTGAGSSICDDNSGGLSMKGLWAEAKKLLNGTANTGDFEKFCQLVHFYETSEDIETLLTHAELFISYNKNMPTTPEAPNEELKFVTDNTVMIKKLILGKCDFADKKPGYTFNKNTHLQFLKNLSYRKSRLSRPKVFTTNYDRTFEVAAASGGFITIDGFSFDSRRSFNGKFFDYDIVLTKNNRVTTEDNFAPNVIHLYKLHGSIDWFQEGKAIIQRSAPSTDELPLMIFPNRDKFQLSYDQPYFEMMSRFQNELRKSGSTTLIIIGFSFGDNHINRVIEEALRHNAFLKIIVIDKFLSIPYPAGQQPQGFLQTKASETEQVLFIREAFADFVKYMPSPRERGVEIFGEKDDSRIREQD
jgi:hypothetical protein